MNAVLTLTCVLANNVIVLTHLLENDVLVLTRVLAHARIDTQVRGPQGADRVPRVQQLRVLLHVRKPIFTHRCN